MDRLSINLEGAEVDLTQLLEIEGVVLVEIVDGQYRIELLQETTDVSLGVHDERRRC